MYPAETAGCCVFWPRPAAPETWSSSARPGYSGLWFSLALSKTGGHLTTFDIDKGRFEMARNNFKKAGVDGIVTQVLGDAHKEVARLKDPIDLLFIDADKQGYLDSSPSCCPWFAPAA